MPRLDGVVGLYTFMLVNLYFLALFNGPPSLAKSLFKSLSSSQPAFFMGDGNNIYCRYINAIDTLNCLFNFRLVSITVHFKNIFIGFAQNGAFFRNMRLFDNAV